MKKIKSFPNKASQKICFLALMVLSSCVSKEDRWLFDKMKGTWEINEITYLDRDYRDSLFLNVLFFEEENSPILTIPKTTSYNKDKAFWSIETIEGRQYLNISTKNKVFDGLYNMEFFNNEERGLLGVELISDSLRIVAFKFPR